MNAWTQSPDVVFVGADKRQIDPCFICFMDGGDREDARIRGDAVCWAESGMDGGRRASASLWPILGERLERLAGQEKGRSADPADGSWLAPH